MSLNIDFNNRVEKIRREMENRNVRVLVVAKQGGVHYLLGEFSPWKSAVIIPLEGKIRVATLDTDAERLQKGTWVKDFYNYTWSKGMPSFSQAVAHLLTEMGVNESRIGMEFDSLTVKEFNELQSLLPRASFEDCSSVLDNVMIIKEDVEIEFLKRAAQIADCGVYAGFQSLEVGMTETEVVAYMDFAMRKAGNEWDWSVTGGSELGSGERTAYHQGWSQPATRKIIQKDDMIIFDIHPMYNLYLGDQASNAIIGKPNEKQKRLIDAWKQGVQVLIDSMRPGVIGREIAAKMISLMKKKAFEEQTVSLFGHGLGTTSRMPPTITPDCDVILQPNMIVEAVLNITQPGVGGMRLETPVRITENEPEVFSKLPLDIMVKGIDFL